MEVQRRAVEIEHQAQLAEMKLAEAGAVRDRATMEAELERARERREWEHALQQRELEAQAAAQALPAKELEAQALDSEGRHDEATAVRAEAEKMRREVDALRRSVNEEHLLRSASDLELQMESQLEALRHLQAEGAEDEAEVQEKIERLEAALDALRGTEN